MCLVTVAYSSFRIRNIKKEYNGKHEKIEALQGKEKNIVSMMFLIIFVLSSENTDHHSGKLENEYR